MFEPHFADDLTKRSPMTTHFRGPDSGAEGTAMPGQKPPSNAVFARAAEKRVGGATWKTIAKEVHRAERTARGWPLRYPDRWFAALLAAERFMTANADCESVHTLRRLLQSEDEKIRWHAAKALINRRVDRDRIELKSPKDSDSALSNEALQFLCFLDRHSNEELEEIVSSVEALPAEASAVEALPAEAPGEGEQPPGKSAA